VALFAGGANVVLAQLDKLVEPLEKTLTAKIKSDAVKQEVRLDRPQHASLYWCSTTGH
jgi:hypothetical protein